MKKRGSSPNGGSRKSGRGRNKVEPNKFEVYAERTIWSPRYKGWTKYEVKKPRLPTENDKLNWVDNFVGRPTLLTAFSGKSNDSAVRSLSTLVDQFDSTKNLQDLLIIAGPGGSGKSALAQVYIQEMLTRMELPFNVAPKWCMYADAKKYNATTYHELWRKVKDFLESPQDKNIKVPMKVVLIDDCDTIPATHQNSLKTIMDKNSLRLKWIFTAKEPRKFIQFFQTKAMQIKTRLSNEKETLNILLQFFQRFKIGNDRQGVKALVDSIRETPTSTNLSLSKLLNIAQRTFEKFHFISAENIVKITNMKPAPKIVSAYAAIEPLSRCKRCTLFPPCDHITREYLIEKATAQRNAYPTYVGQGRPVCPEFIRLGRCSTFNKHKRCNLAHPMTRSIVEQDRIRCPLCTITWPCQKCEYSKARNGLISLLDEIDRRIELLRTINVPEPPIHLVIHLMDQFDDWEMSIAAMADFYMTTAKQKVRDEIAEWIKTSLCTSEEEYGWKHTHLSRTFGEVVTSPLLIEKTRGTSNRQSRQSGRGSRPNTNGEFDDGSSVTRSVTSAASSRPGSRSMTASVTGSL